MKSPEKLAAARSRMRSNITTPVTILQHNRDGYHWDLLGRLTSSSPVYVCAMCVTDVSSVVCNSFVKGVQEALAMARVVRVQGNLDRRMLVVVDSGGDKVPLNME